MGSRSKTTCCANSKNTGYPSNCPHSCYNQTADADFIFGLWPGPPAKFGPTGADTRYQFIDPSSWPKWGNGGGGSSDLSMGGGGPPGVQAACNQGYTYAGREN